MECRIYAEDPDNNFFPSPGKIISWTAPAGPGIRLDAGVYAGFTVPGDYDPLLGKLIAWGADRAEAVARLRGALREFDVAGIRTNVRLFQNILRDTEFLRGDIHTRWLDQRLHSLVGESAAPGGDSSDGKISPADIAAIAALLWQRNQAAAPPDSAAKPSAWKLEGRREQLSRDPRQ
jgi:acetyl-CoA carboxylase biotin carboxylase subunit